MTIHCRVLFNLSMSRIIAVQIGVGVRRIARIARGYAAKTLLMILRSFKRDLGRSSEALGNKRDVKTLTSKFATGVLSINSPISFD